MERAYIMPPVDVQPPWRPDCQAVSYGRLVGGRRRLSVIVRSSWAGYSPDASRPSPFEERCLSSLVVRSHST